MATSKIAATEGSGVNIATHSFSEDAVTKQLQRVTPTNSSGAEIGTAASPIFTISSISGTSGASIIGTVPVTQSGDWNVSSLIGAVTLYAQPGNFVSGVSSIVTGTAAVSVLGAPGASLRNFITAIKVTNAAATGVIVDIKDSGAGVLDSGFAAASGGGWSTTFPTPIRQANTNASIDVVPRAQGSIIATISGFKGA